MAFAAATCEGRALNGSSTLSLLLGLVALLLIIAFSSGTEVAMLSVNRYRIRHRAHTGQGTAKLLDRLLQKPDDWLGANLVILAAASVFASSIATLLAQRSGNSYAVPATSAALTVIVIVFCELAPKIYAATYPEWVALRSAHIYRALVLLARPLLWVTNQLAYGVLRVFGVVKAARSSQNLSTEELRTVVAEAGPMIPARHRQMLLSILDLGQLHRERHHGAAPGDCGHRRAGEAGRTSSISCARRRTRACRSMTVSSTTSSASCT